MKKIWTILLTVCILAGCSPKETATCTLYFVSANGQEMETESRAVPHGGSLLEEAVKALLEGPRRAGLARVIPEGTALNSVKKTGTVAEIDLTAPFDTGQMHTRLLSRYTVIYTACAVEDVQKVKLLVDGEPLRSLSDGEPLGALGTAELTASMPASGAQGLITLYFPDQSGMYLMPDSRQVTLEDGQTMEAAVVTEILRGPTATHLAPAVSEDTQVLSVETRGGVCFVNMDESFIKENTGDAQKEKIAIYSIVNSLCALPNVKEVRFLFDGRTVKNFGKLATGAGLTENKTLYPAI